MKFFYLIHPQSPDCSSTASCSFSGYNGNWVTCVIHILNILWSAETGIHSNNNIISNRYSATSFEFIWPHCEYPFIFTSLTFCALYSPQRRSASEFIMIRKSAKCFQRRITRIQTQYLLIRFLLLGFHAKHFKQ